MKTTLNLDDTVMAHLKQEGARQGRTMSELVESALCNLLQGKKSKPELPPLPTFRSGGHLVDPAALPFSEGIEADDRADYLTSTATLLVLSPNH